MKKTVSMILTTGLLLGTVSFSALAQGCPGMDRMFNKHHQGGRQEMPFRTLNLTVEQQKKMLELRQAFERDTQTQHFELQKLHLELRELWSVKPLNQTQIGKKTQQEARLKLQIDEQAQKMREQVNKLLTAAQRQELTKAPAGPDGPAHFRLHPKRKPGEKLAGKAGVHGRHGMFPGPGGPKEDLPGLTGEQQKQILTLRQEFEKDTLSLHQALQQKKLELRLLKEAKPLNIDQIVAQTGEVTNLRVQFANKFDKMQTDLKKLLTKEQLEKWESQTPKNSDDCAECRKPAEQN